jgi:hypothetical protein
MKTKLFLCVLFLLPSATIPPRYEIYKNIKQRIAKIEKELGIQNKPLEFKLIETADSSKYLIIRPYLTDLDSIVFITKDIANWKDTTTVWSYGNGLY